MAFSTVVQAYCKHLLSFKRLTGGMPACSPMSHPCICHVWSSMATHLPCWMPQAGLPEAVQQQSNVCCPVQASLTRP